MNNFIRKILLLRGKSGNGPTRATATNMAQGEIAIEYLKGCEGIYLKNSDNEIVKLNLSSSGTSADGFIGTTKVQNTSKPQNLSGIKFLNIVDTEDTTKSVSINYTNADNKVNIPSNVSSTSFIECGTTLETKYIQTNITDIEDEYEDIFIKEEDKK